MNTKNTKNVLHSSATNEHYTPPSICEKNTVVMGGIELDPASNRLANTLVKANRIYSMDEGVDGLYKPWECRSLQLNPPGGTTRDKNLIERYGTSSWIAIWCRELQWRYERGEVEQAIFIGFQLSILRLCPGLLKLPLCIPRQRIAFWTTPGALRSAEKAKQKPNMVFIERWIEKCRQGGEWVKTQEGVLMPSHSPSHDNVIIFFPPKGREKSAIAQFKEQYAPLGEINF